MAARIASKAHAGEILVSSIFKAVTDSAGDLQFDEGYDVELKGLTGTYRVHRVLWSDEERSAQQQRRRSRRRRGAGSYNAEPARDGAKRRRAPGRVGANRVDGWIGVAIAGFFVIRGTVERAHARESRAAASACQMHTDEQPALEPEPKEIPESAPVQAAPPSAHNPPAAEVSGVSINAPGISAEDREKALAAVSDWLELMDKGHLPRAWEQSNLLVPKEEWAQKSENSARPTRSGDIPKPRGGRTKSRPQSAPNAFSLSNALPKRSSGHRISLRDPAPQRRMGGRRLFREDGP